MKLVITGALGHIGSSLIRNLGGMAWDEVVLIDNLATQRYCSLFNLPENVPFRFVEADVLSDRMEPLLSGADVVIHLAAITNAAGSFDREKEVEEVKRDEPKLKKEADDAGAGAGMRRHCVVRTDRDDLVI